MGEGAAIAAAVAASAKFWKVGGGAAPSGASPVSVPCGWWVARSQCLSKPSTLLSELLSQPTVCSHLYEPKAAGSASEAGDQAAGDRQAPSGVCVDAHQCPSERAALTGLSGWPCPLSDPSFPLAREGEVQTGPWRRLPTPPALSPGSPAAREGVLPAPVSRESHPPRRLL